MARWVLTTFVALLVNCIAIGDKPSQPATQTQQRIQILPNFRAARLIPDHEKQIQLSYGAKSILDQCLAQPTTLWCAAYKEFHEPLDETMIKTIDSRVRAKFTYLSDRVDNWRVYSLDIMNTREWQGDCDDLSSTAMDMMGRQGQPLDRMWLVLVASQFTSKIDGRLDHLVAVIEDDQGKFWIVGDTSGVTQEVKDMKYRPLLYMSANDMTWHHAETDNNFATRFGVEPWSLGDRQPRLEPGTMRPLPDEIPVLVENR